MKTKRIVQYLGRFRIVWSHLMSCWDWNINQRHCNHCRRLWCTEETSDMFFLAQVWSLVTTHFCSRGLPLVFGVNFNPLFLADDSLPSIENLNLDPFLAVWFGLGMYCQVGEFVGEVMLSPLISRQVAVLSSLSFSSYTDHDSIKRRFKSSIVLEFADIVPVRMKEHRYFFPTTVAQYSQLAVQIQTTKLPRVFRIRSVAFSGEQLSVESFDFLYETLEDSKAMLSHQSYHSNSSILPPLIATDEITYSVVMSHSNFWGRNWMIFTPIIWDFRDLWSIHVTEIRDRNSRKNWNWIQKWFDSMVISFLLNCDVLRTVD